MSPSLPGGEPLHPAKAGRGFNAKGLEGGKGLNAKEEMKETFKRARHSFLLGAVVFKCYERLWSWFKLYSAPNTIASLKLLYF